ncbi:hypothetical protein [Streptomyces sp. NPDC001680]
MKRARRWLDERGVGWRQITGQIVYVAFVCALVISLLSYARHD